MNERTTRLRERSLTTQPSISAERAQLVTRFYAAGGAELSPPLRRARGLPPHLRAQDHLPSVTDELIVGERGPTPSRGLDLPGADLPQPRGPAHPRQPGEDRLRGRRRGARRPTAPRSSRSGRAAACATASSRAWTGMARGLRGRHLHRVHGAARPGTHRGRRQDLPQGHAGLQGRHRARPSLRWDGQRRPRRAAARLEQLAAMDIAADAIILFAERHAAQARELAAAGTSPSAGPSSSASPTSASRVPRACPARLPRSAADVLVLPPGRSSPSSTAGTPSPRATSTSTWSPSTSGASPTGA